MTQQRLTWGLLAVWLVIYAWSFLAFLTTQPEGDGFTRGLNRLTAFFGWQLAAGLLALVVWWLGLSLQRGSVGRWLSRLPVALAVVLLLGIFGIVIFVSLTG